MNGIEWEKLWCWTYYTLSIFSYGIMDKYILFSLAFSRKMGDKAGS